MDGAPVRGESIPIRLFLHVYGLSPTMRDVYRKFSVRYFLNLVLLDEEDRRYYKQQVRILYLYLKIYQCHLVIKQAYLFFLYLFKYFPQCGLSRYSFLVDCTVI